MDLVSIEAALANRALEMIEKALHTSHVARNAMDISARLNSTPHVRLRPGIALKFLDSAIHIVVYQKLGAGESKKVLITPEPGLSSRRPVIKTRPR